MLEVLVSQLEFHHGIADESQGLWDLLYDCAAFLKSRLEALLRRGIAVEGVPFVLTFIAECDLLGRFVLTYCASTVRQRCEEPCVEAALVTAAW